MNKEEGNPVPTFDLSGWLDKLCRDIARRVPELSHIEAERVLFCLSRSRAPGKHGVYARIAPLRYAGGKQETALRRGRYRELYALPRLRHEGREILYLVYLMIPRLLRLPFREKLRTIIHELYHISPDFDGDIRRFPGRNYAHGSSRAAYNQRIDTLVTAWLDQSPDKELLEPLHLREEDWISGTIRLTGLRVPLPRAQLVSRRRT
ncbi:MAG TPA: putative metallopeptidase [Desulfuromonadales bacterium]|nr:putative metallopeptidase [Desulfuromonadales bacterium]